MPIPVIQTRLKLLFTNADLDVTTDIMPDMLSFSYEDKETNEAEEINLVLKDPDGKWANKWQPNGGEVIKAYIMQGNIDEVTKTLYCGEFYVDELSVKVKPRTFEMKAVSIPLNKPIRRKLKTRAWEKTTLKAIASQIAAEAEISLLFDSEENPTYDREEQDRESDLKFLSRLCEDAGLSIKVTSRKLVIFNQAFYEKKKPIKTITVGNSNILSGNFSASQSETYKSCTITYRDPKKKKANEAAGHSLSDKKSSQPTQNSAVLTYTYVDPLADENGQEYTMNERATSLEDAKRLAKAKLRKLNARKVTGSISLVGDVSLVAGAVIKCQGFGVVDGNFIIETANHTVSNVYTTSLTLRRVNTNY